LVDPLRLRYPPPHHVLYDDDPTPSEYFE